MRRDMAKLIVERPRHEDGWGRTKGRRAQTPHELQQAFEGIKEQKGGTKSLNENLAPLRRFIKKQVNRPWNKVFSELNEFIKPGNTVQEHVLSHLHDFIAIKVTRVPLSEKFPCGLRQVQARYGGLNPVRAGDLYVDPDDNIIKVAKARIFFAKPARSKRELVFDGKDRICCTDQGLWYSTKIGRYELESYKVPVPLDPDKPSKYRFERTKLRFVIDGQRIDVLSDATFGLVQADETLRLEKKYGGKGVYGIHGTRRQLSSKDLKRLGLENEVRDDTRPGL